MHLCSTLYHCKSSNLRLNITFTVFMFDLVHCDSSNIWLYIPFTAVMFDLVLFLQWLWSTFYHFNSSNVWPCIAFTAIMFDLIPLIQQKSSTLYHFYSSFVRLFVYLHQLRPTYNVIFNLIYITLTQIILDLISQ